MSTELMNTYTFRVNGMHCVKCIRKIQDVADQFQTVKRLDVNLSDHLVTAEARSDFALEKFMRKIELKGFGIKCIPEENKKTSLNRYQKDMLMRIGVAGACSGNIMLLSVAEYVGANIPEWPSIFISLSFLFFIPVFLYSAQPLYKSTWASLKNKRISIDVPIVLAIIGGALISFYNLSANKDHIYFDSISMFVFFLLGSRYIVQKIQSKYIQPVSTKDVFDQTHVLIVKGNERKLVEVDKVVKGDSVVIPKGAYISFDGVIESEYALINDAFYTGEFLPIRKSKLDMAFAGSKNEGSEFILKVLKEKKDSRLSEIISKLNISLKSRTPLVALADQGARALTYGILASSFALLSYHFYMGNFIEGINRVLALLVVACPCGLAIATPLVQTLGLKKALGMSLLIKDVSVFESIKNIKKVYFDKTGTLTKAEIKISNWSPREPKEFEKRIMFKLEEESEHPVGRALRKNLSQQESINVTNINEKIGSGVMGEYEGKKYFLKSSSDKESSLVLEVDNKIVLQAGLVDEINLDSKETISYLRNKGLDVFILSGDKKETSLKVAKSVGVPLENVFAERSPLEKEKIITTNKDEVLYVGDGINDSLAMSKSLISVSVDSSADVAFKSSKIHIIEGGVKKLIDVFKLSAQSNKAMNVIIFISLIYNLIFAVLAAMGMIKPLIAVLIMPLSSLAITFIGLYMMSSFKRSSL